MRRRVRRGARDGERGGLDRPTPTPQDDDAVEGVAVVLVERAREPATIWSSREGFPCRDGERSVA